MNEQMFKATTIAVAAIFTGIFCWVVIPPLVANPDIIGALAAGFANPYSSGYSADVLACWAILTAWITHEAQAYGVKHGWLCVLLCLFPGVAVGFGAYLPIRMRQVKTS